MGDLFFHFLIFVDQKVDHLSITRHVLIYQSIKQKQKYCCILESAENELVVAVVVVVVVQDPFLIENIICLSKKGVSKNYFTRALQINKCTLKQV
ncbi:MAG: hypothetical protein ACI8RD_002458 [Bacillariaceae sp.]|jgi:hypothetical protein